MNLKTKIIVSFLALSIVMIGIFAVQGTKNQEFLIENQKQELALQVEKSINTRLEMQLETVATSLIPVSRTRMY